MYALDEQRSAPADIRAVVFDFGGVLFDWDPQHLYRTLIDDDATRADFLARICSPAWNLCQDQGRSLAEATALLVAQHPQHAELIRAYYARWPEMLRGPLHEGVALLQRLHALQVPLFGLTNWSAETFPYAQANYPFLGLFRDIVVSGAEKCIKPDPALYRIALQRYARHVPGLRPEHLLFLDDSARNVEAARALGWHAIHHVDAQHTAAQLRALGVPV